MNKIKLITLLLLTLVVSAQGQDYYFKALCTDTLGADMKYSNTEWESTKGMMSFNDTTIHMFIDNIAYDLEVHKQYPYQSRQDKDGYNCVVRRFEVLNESNTLDVIKIITWEDASTFIHIYTGKYKITFNVDEL